MNTFTCYCSSPVGQLQLQGTEEYITAIHFMDEEKNESAIAEVPAVLQTAIKQLNAYFSGERKVFDFPIQQTGTAFQQNVWKGLTQIAYGTTISYLNFSKQLGDVKAIRAVASANGKNNLAIVIPCHRVIGSNQKLVGYAGGLWRKKWLLQHEAKYHLGLQLFDF